jgi:AcrR family transcriptional regulator
MHFEKARMSITSPSSVSLRERRRNEDLARRRDDAIAGASMVFAAKGFHDAQMSEIAVAAEVSRNSLYAMFESKERLYQEVIETTFATIRDFVMQRASEIEDPGEQLLSIIGSLFSCYEKNQDLLHIYARGTHGMPIKIRDAMGESSMQMFQSFTGWVIEVATRAKDAGSLPGLDPETLAVCLVGSVTTTAARWIELTPERPLSEQSTKVHAVFAELIGGGADL